MFIVCTGLYRGIELGIAFRALYLATLRGSVLPRDLCL